MRIAFVKSHIDKSLQWEWFSEELQKRGIHHIYIIIREYEPEIVKDLKARGVKVYLLAHKNPVSIFRNISKVKKILKKEKIDVVHSGLPYGNIVGLLAAKRLNIHARVSTIDNVSWAEDYNNKKQKQIDRFTYKNANKIVVLTELSKKYVIDRDLVDPEKLDVIGHSLKVSDYSDIDPDRIAKLKTELGIEEGDFVLGMVARLEDWKGHSYVIEAVKSLVEKHPNIKLLIFGLKGDCYDDLMNQIADLGLENHVFYKGFCNDSIGVYQVFDLHIHVPVNEIVETYGLSIIEGMISGCTQVLTKSGISIYTAQHMKNCIEVDYCNAEQITNAINLLIENPELKKQLADQAKADAIEQFSYKVKVDKHIKIYQKLLSE